MIFAGRLERIKGPHFLVDAVGRLDANVHLVLCGATRSPSYLRELECLAQGHRVSFLGPRSDVPALMAAADISVLPSIFLETQGLVISESMACETPVVASDIGGLGATMRGFPEQLVPPGDPVRLAAGHQEICHLAAHRSRSRTQVESLGAGAHEVQPDHRRR